MLKLNFFICLSLLAFACSDKVEKQKEIDPNTSAPAKETNRFESFEKGKVLPTVKCKSDSNNTYALYVPLSYDGNSRFPLVVFFDPHASGALPLKKYSALAEKFGFIFAGSNNSKNGNTAEVNGAFAGGILNDVQARLNLDMKRIYTSGFSGGSRVASIVAIYRGGINSVIGMGAGFPNIDKPIENKFNYVGIAGNQDFNYTEMEDLEKALTGSDVDHIFIPFSGKHEWCPLETMDEALTWIEFKDMKRSIAIKNDSLIKNYIEIQLGKIAQLSKNEAEAFNQCKLALNFISGLAQNEMLNALYSKLEKSGAVKKSIARNEELAKAEKALKNQYLNALAIKDAVWWKAEVQNLTNNKKFPPDQLAMNKRILSYMSLASYMNINQLLQNKQEQEAEHFISIYKIVDPENAEAPYLNAKILLSKNKNAEALAELKNAAKLGFREHERFSKDFAALQAVPGFDSIGTEIKANSVKEE